MAIYSHPCKRWTGALALSLWLSCASVAHATRPPAEALLRCDPWTVIKSIDGRPSRVKALQGGAFTDCEIPLSAGMHFLKICYEARALQQTGTGNVIHRYQCASDREVSFDAVAGRIYRIRLSVEPAFAVRVDDVTSAERDIAVSPSMNGSRRVAKADRTSTIVVRVLGVGMPTFMPGAARNAWFKPSRLQQALHGAKGMQPAAQGYFMAEVANGDTIAIRHLLAGGVTSFVCDTEVPVYDDLPGGRVLYLGDYRFEPQPDGTWFRVTRDEQAAREFLGAHRPELAGKLETATFRQLRVPEPCALLPMAHRLHQAAD